MASLTPFPIHNIRRAIIISRTCWHGEGDFSLVLLDGSTVRQSKLFPTLDEARAYAAGLRIVFAWPIIEHLDRSAGTAA